MKSICNLPDTTAGILVAIKLMNNELKRTGRPPLTEMQEQALLSEREAFALVDEIESELIPAYPIGEVRALVVEAHLLWQRELSMSDAESIFGYI